MSDLPDVQDFIDRFNAERGRGGDGDEEEEGRLERLRASVLEDEEDGD